MHSITSVQKQGIMQSIILIEAESQVHFFKVICGCEYITQYGSTVYIGMAMGGSAL